MIDCFASEAHYLDHLLPVALELEARVLVTSAELRDRARDAGVRDVAIGSPRKPNGAPVLVAAYKDADWTSKERRVGLLEHGAGQTYSGVQHRGYSGGPGWDHCSLFLCPGEHVAARWRRRYPAARVEVVGCPRLDRIERRAGDEPLVVFTFHWPCRQAPEAGTAFHDYRHALAALAAAAVGYTIAGHWHPRWGDDLRAWYQRVGIPTIDEADDVLATADVLVADNTSLMYEAAFLGIRVVALNARAYRREVEHGLRFWSNVPGPQVDEPADLAAAVTRAAHARRRPAHDESVYGVPLGLATDTAARVVAEWADA